MGILDQIAAAESSPMPSMLTPPATMPAPSALMPDARGVYPVDMTNDYNTLLSPAEEADYQKEHAPGDSYDYDMRGAFKQGITAAGNGHFPDTFKKPNHPTFSNESIYHGKGGQGGAWSVDAQGRDIFTPGPTNLATHGLEGLQQYLLRSDPNVILGAPNGP